MAKAAFITGGGSGIGLAVARSLAADGWLVGLADINAKALAEAKAAIPAAETYQMDVRDRDAWREALAAFAGKSGGRLDFLFNNAGVAVGGQLETMSDEDVERGLSININGAVYGARAAHDLLKATPGSAMIITSSAAGISGNAGMSVYSAGKFAMRGFAESLNAEWKREGIYVGSLMPSFIDTPLLDHVTQDSNRNVRESVRAAGLEITPVEEVVKTVRHMLDIRRDVHTRVGKTAHRLWFMQRWLPGTLRKLQGRAFK
ncbi:SDR family oxidoreductase [Sphingomonas sp. KR3-1]|uniref:SDR family oxidoreductase n=1 Tax=Sphingomonas sp. KR3-1 TaxID=3156611 RepID=UPI0032B5CED5